jgi:sulfur-carrier protein
MLTRWARRDALAMAVIRFTTHLVQHRPVRAIDAPGTTVAEVLATGLSDDPLLRGYVLDDQGRVRKHVNIYLDGRLITDRLRLSDAVGPASEIYVLQALSGG